MKKSSLSLLILALLVKLSTAQNIQLHYDMGKERNFLTSTVEMFKPDRWGSTFFFIDMDYSSEKRDVQNGLSLAYIEIARSFKWQESQKYSPRIEYNGGVFKLGGDAGVFVPIENCLLAGVERTFASSDFSKIVTLQCNYKYIKGKEDLSFQLTAVWSVMLVDGKITFAGFADFWKEKMFWDTGYRFISEPQLWYNFNKNFSLGSEIELSHNFEIDAFRVNPTVGMKFTF